MSPRFESFDVQVNLPFLSLGGTWKVTRVQQLAAWEMYVELVTRVAVEKLDDQHGLIREAYSSFYSLFGTTREIMRRHGPETANAGSGDISFALVAVAVLNKVVRPLLADWHPRLKDWEEQRPAGTSTAQHERNWPDAAAARVALNETRIQLARYVEQLADVARVQRIHTPIA